MPARLGEELLPRTHVVAANKDGRSLEILRAAGENGAMNQVAHLLRPDSAVTENFIGTGINGHDSIKDARLGIAIELNQDFSLVHVRIP